MQLSKLLPVICGGKEGGGTVTCDCLETDTATAFVPRLVKCLKTFGEVH